MLLLKGATLEAERKIAPQSMSLNLVDTGISTASITLGPDAPEIALGRWLLDDTEPGKGIVWRVKSVETTYETETRTLQLEHVIATLKDGLIFGELGSKEHSTSARGMIETVLSRQKIWTLGSFEFSRSLPYNYTNVTHYSAIEKVCSTLEDYRWEYDLSKLPFKLHILKKDSTIGSELRAGRNLQTIRRTVDMTGMYTRFYPVGARDMHISGDYVSKNEDVYGVISRTETDQSKSHHTMLREWALHRLRRHCEPTVSITIKGLALSQSTGEPLDRLTLGRMCRVPLPEYGTTILEYITRLSWPDKIKAPEDVTITLSNRLADADSLNSLASKIKEMSESSGSNSAGGAAAAGEDHAWIVDTDEKVGLVAESIIGRDPNGNEVDWSRVSEIIVDGEGIHQRVTRTEGELVTAETRIEMNEEQIRLEAERATAEEGKLLGRITVEAGKITAEVTRAKNAESALSGRLTVEADKIAAEVTRATAAEGVLTGKLTVEADRITAEVTRATGVEGKLSTRITQTADKVSIIATDKDIDDFIKSGGSGSMFTVTRSQITSAVGQITAVDGRVSTIEGSGIWQNRDSITQIAGKFRVTSSGNVRLEEGASLQVQRDGVYQTVGTVNYVNDKISTITGSALWTQRNAITGVVGKFSVTSSGNIRLEEGADLQVYSDGGYHGISAVAGKVRVNSSGNVVVDGAALIVKDENGKSSNVTQVAGKFSVTSNGDVRLTDGTGLYVTREKTAIEVADKGTIVTSINASKEGVKILAAKVDLGDYATVGQLDAAVGNFDKLVAGTTIAKGLKAQALAATKTFTYQGHDIKLSERTFITAVDFTKPSLTKSSNRNFMYADNAGSTTASGTALGGVVTSWSAGSLSVSSTTEYFMVQGSEE